MFLGNKSYDYHSIKQKYKHLDVLPDAVFDLSKVKVVLGQDNYHLLCPMEYKKGHKMNPGRSEINWDGRSVARFRNMKWPMLHQLRVIWHQKMAHSLSPGSVWNHTRRE